MPIPFPVTLNPAVGHEFVDVASVPGGGDNIWELFETAEGGGYVVSTSDQCLWVVQSAFQNFSLKVNADGSYILDGTLLGLTDQCSVYMWDESASTWLGPHLLTLTVNNTVGLPPLEIASAWPIGLQQFLNEGRFTQKQQDTNIITKVETGARKIRRRFTQPTTEMSCQIWIPKSQYQTFLDFYNVTLQNGSLPFTFNDPITGTERNWRFLQPFQSSYLGGVNFVIDMMWEAVDDAS
jgi:hypothetical protein